MIKDTIQEGVILIVVALIGLWVLPKLLSNLWTSQAQLAANGVRAVTGKVSAAVHAVTDPVSDGLESIFVSSKNYITTAQQHQQAQAALAAHQAAK